MRRLLVAILVLALLAAFAPPAIAGSSTDIALGLASFAVFNQLFAPALFGSYYARPRHVVEHVYVPQPTVVYVQPAAPVPSVVSYPHGRYELFGSQWVWIPNAPAPPPQPSAVAVCSRYTGKFVKTTQGLLPECE